MSVTSFDPDGELPPWERARLARQDPTLARYPQVAPAESGDRCDVCGDTARYRVGWAPTGDEPRGRWPYCAYHGRPHSGIPVTPRR